jgi:TonB family protein
MKHTFIALALCLVVAPLARGQDAVATLATAERTYLDFQVDQIVRVRTRAVPVYPEKLRAQKVDGNVLVQFNVDERGVAQMQTFKVLRSSSPAFTEAVRRAISSTAFHPAETGGRKVTQLVQQEFKFDASR